MFLTLPIIFKHPLTFGAATTKTSFCALLFVISMIIAGLILYVSKLHGRMNVTITENMRLLDGMHEGLLIVSKEEKGIMFCNRPA